MHTLGDVQEDPVVPERGVQRLELPLLGRNGFRGEVLFQELGMVLHRFMERLEHHTFGGEVGIEVRVDHMTVDDHDVA
jgi:hypothetical protein